MNIWSDIMVFLEFVSNNLYLYLAIIIALLIVDIILSIVCINQRKRKNIKDEFVEIEKQEQIDDDIKPEVAFELEQILNQMQQDIETKPEEVVRMFEEEQEQKAIISYQELVDSVNNNKIEELKNLLGLNFVCSTRKIENNLKMVLTKNRNCDTINIVIGPEGGLSNLEEDYLNSIGYDSVTLGMRIMRVESVPLFILSIINYEYME